MFKPIGELLDMPEALSRLPGLYSTDGQELDDQVLVFRFYHPLCRWSWYAVEYDPAEKVFFGWTDGEFQEWGNFSLLEMAFVEDREVPIFWDVDFKPIRFGDLKAGLREG